MKVLFLGRGNNHPATRYRIVSYLPYLRNQGIEAEVRDFPADLFGWWQLTRRGQNYAVVFIQKKRVSHFWLKRFRARGAKIVYDFDDAIMFASSRHPTPHSPRRMKEFVRMLRSADAVIAGNAYLKSQAEPYHHRLYLLPTPIDLAKYPVRDYETPPATPLTLGWVGGAKSLVFLKELWPVLETLGEASPLQLKIVCNRFLPSERIRIVKKFWSESEEVADILSFDIGLAPLPDDPWSRGKCATKLLQYLAGGIPAVASPVGMHSEIIRDGVNGFLAQGPEEWTEKISRLINDRSLRKTMGLAGRQTVQERYAVAVQAPALLGILKEVIRTS